MFMSCFMVSASICVTRQLSFIFYPCFGAWPLGVGPLPFRPPRVKGLGERRELPQWGLGRSHGRQSSFGIFEAHRTANQKLNFSEETTQSID